MKNLKGTLQQLTENGSVDFKPQSGALPGTCYLISTEERKGVTWSEPPKSTVASVLHVDKSVIDKIDSGIFKKVSIQLQHVYYPMMNGSFIYIAQHGELPKQHISLLP